MLVVFVKACNFALGLGVSLLNSSHGAHGFDIDVLGVLHSSERWGMEIIDKIDEHELVCPCSGELIIGAGEPVNESAVSLMGYWHSDVLGEPSLFNSDLASAWCEFCNGRSTFMSGEDDSSGDLDDSEDDDVEDALDLDWKVLEDFLVGYENDDWIVYAISDTADHSTAWFVVDSACNS